MRDSFVEWNRMWEKKRPTGEGLNNIRNKDKCHGTILFFSPGISFGENVHEKSVYDFPDPSSACF